MNNLFYETLEEKGQFFNKVKNDIDWRIETKDKFEEFYRYISSKSYIYRGVSEAKYRLFTSVQRAFIENRINIKSKDIISFINDEIQNFKKNDLIVKYWNSLNVPITDFLCLSFLQHYGAPTTFLDFTHDLDIALYFATENINYNMLANSDIDKYFSIYWFDRTNSKDELVDVLTSYQNSYNYGHKLLKDHISMYPNDEIDTSNLTNPDKYLSWYNSDNMGEGLCTFHLGFIDIYNSCFKDNNDEQNNISKLKMVHLNNFIKIINLNIVAQKGCFIHYIYNNNPFMPLEDYIHTNKLENISIYCVNIHKSLVPYIKNKITSKNITKDNIYPDPGLIVRNVYYKSLEDL